MSVTHPWPEFFFTFVLTPLRYFLCPFLGGSLSQNQKQKDSMGAYLEIDQNFNLLYLARNKVNRELHNQNEFHYNPPKTPPEKCSPCKIWCKYFLKKNIHIYKLMFFSPDPTPFPGPGELCSNHFIKNNPFMKCSF